MLQMFGLIIICACLVMLVLSAALCIAQLIRLRFWSKFFSSQIDRVSAARKAGKHKEPWPNVRASYDNFKWYQPFRYDFESMIVYDTSH